MPNISAAEIANHSDFPPTTVSREALLVGGSDSGFRLLVDKLLRFGAELQKAREALARALGLTPPQYSILMAVARAKTQGTVTVTDVAEALRVSLPFVVTQTGLLVRAGFLLKRANKQDRRFVNLALTDRGIEALRNLAPMHVRINDALFASLSRSDAETLGSLIDGLLDSAEGLELEAAFRGDCHD